MRDAEGLLAMKTLQRVAVTMAVAALAMAARAGYTKANLPSGGGTLANGTMYVVSDSSPEKTLTGPNGKSALYVAANATAAIFIPAGVTLKVRGGNASGRTGAGAGINIPNGSTLVVTGGGTLEATGGNGASGSSGESGTDGVVIDDDSSAHDEEGYAGKGGDGGDGGGGAGAGIGGGGGSGAHTPAEPNDYDSKGWHNTDGNWKAPGFDGHDGRQGTAGGDCGTLYVLGSVTVKPTGGAKGPNGGSQGGGGSLGNEQWWLAYRAGGGGGGGGGGYGNAADRIGGGGGGGGSGGGGGGGGRYRTSRDMIKYSARGGFGGGGSNGGQGKRTDGEDGMHGGDGGDGGSGGSAGSGGSLKGTVYKGANATIKDYSGATAADSHAAIMYTITFSDAYRVSQTATVKLGYTPPNAPCPSRRGYTFAGWFQGVTQYYGADGKPVKSMWTTANDITLSARWTQNADYDESDVTLTVNGVDIVNGADASGTGWSYSGATGKLVISGANGTYDISGRDLDGMAAIEATCNCTIQVSTNLTMDASLRAGRASVTVLAGHTVTFDVQDGATCSLTGGDGATAIRVPLAAALVLKTPGILNVKGGAGAADLGCDANATSWGSIYVETRTNWAANIRPGHGMEANNGLLNNIGNGAVFLSMNTNSVRLWSVQMSGLGNNATKRLYLQRVSETLYDDIKADQYGHAWLWVPENGYEWSTEEVATSTNSLWVADADEHKKADFFAPLLVTVNGEDAAHLTGPGWQCRRKSGSESFASLHLKGTGPYVLGGSGNVMVEIWADMHVTVSNLLLNVTSWDGATALYLHDKRNLQLTLKGDSSFESAPGCAGIFADDTNSLTIDGDGTLSVCGGSNAAGIGGCKKWPTGGTITINGGDITASGGPNGAGIGGANTTKLSKPITINRGIVKALGGENGAGIGGGKGGNASVTINGGTVFPTAGSRASAIGAGYGWTGAGSANRFSDGAAAIYASLAAVSPAPTNAESKAVFPVPFDLETPNCKVTRVILSGVTNNAPVDLWTDETGHLTLWLPSGKRKTATITTDDGVDHSSGYKVDPNGDVEFCTDVVLVDSVPVVGGVDANGGGWAYSSVTSNLVFSAGTHTISGNSTNGTIRVVTTGSDVELAMTGLTLLTPVSYLSPFVVSNRCTVTLSGENYVACVPIGRQSAKYVAGMEVPEGASLTIDGDGLLLAMGGSDGAGIGSRGQMLHAGSITIAGGYIYAYGGEKAAGVGGGGDGSVESILVTGGYIHATGGRYACGIGFGKGNTSLLPDGVFRVTGGTVVAQKGKDASRDFVFSTGNTVPLTTSKAIVIDGGSVRPSSPFEADNPYPNPVSSSGRDLVHVTLNDLVPFDEVTVTDGLWPQYQDATLVADEYGTLCLWGEKSGTNATRTVMISSINLPGGQSVLNVSAYTNSVFSVNESSGEAPESRIVVTEDGSNICWRVTVPALPPTNRLAVTGIDSKYLRGTIISDSDGNVRFYLPNGEYDFRLSGLSYHASVTGAATVATYVVGITVGGTDIGVGHGDGWTYDWMQEKLTFTKAGEYLVAGTNEDRNVSVCSGAQDVKVRADRLVLSSTGDAFRVPDGASLEFVGGTMTAGTISDPITISGGSITANFGPSNAVNAAGKPVYCMKVVGIGRYAKAEISGLPDYDTEGIYANVIGEAYLYLPAGACYITLKDRPLATIVTADGTAVAHEYNPTGIMVDGADVALLAADGWRNDDGVVSLTKNKATYVITGTNFGSAVSFLVTGKNVTLHLRDVVMTNGMDTVAQIRLAMGITAATIELEGTNILFGAESNRCAICLGNNVQLTVEGAGRLYAAGGEGAAGIGSDSRSGLFHGEEYRQKGGTVVVAAGAGGSKDLDTKLVSVYGGSLHLASNSTLNELARNSKYAIVYCVTIPTGHPDTAASELFGEEFLGYPLNGASTDAEGKLYLWMPEGTYYASLEGVPHRAVVTDANTEFAPWAVGVEVDGVDVSYGAGDAWTYDIQGGILSVFGDCTISGSNAVGLVSIEFTNDVSVTVSDLTVLTGDAVSKSAMYVQRGANVVLNLVGENSLTSMGEGRAGINVQTNASLKINGRGALSAAGGEGAAGIGGNPGEGYGRIEIFSGTVTAAGGAKGAGIGSGSFDGYDDVNSNIIGEIAVSGNAEVVATGGEYGAGIGGGSNHRGGNVSITNGIVKATGGQGGAGIGGGYLKSAMPISILGGTVVAEAGELVSWDHDYDASDIGAGELSESVKRLPPLTIKRSSVHVMNGLVAPAASNGTERVYCVTVDTRQPNSDVEVLDLPGYEEFDGIRSDEAGMLYLWLPNGTYVFFAGDIPFVATVAGADTVAQEDFTGVMVDGVDAAYCEGKGRRWLYDRVAKTLKVVGNCVVAGTNTEGKVSIVADAAADVTLSNLLLVAASPITTHADLSLLGRGVNEVGSSASVVAAGTGTVTFACGTFKMDGNVTCKAHVVGGSLDLDGNFVIAPSNDTARVYCVTLSNLTAGARAAISGLPDYYNTSHIYPDAEGKAYLWLPVDWGTGQAQTGTTVTNKITVNGYGYTVIMNSDGSSTTESNELLEVEGFLIKGFSVDGDTLTINVASTPSTWLYGFRDQVRVRTSDTLSTLKTSAATVVDLPSANVNLEDDGSVTYSVALPHSDSASRFFMIEKR